MTDSHGWDLLSSNESESDVYWPDSEFDDTASLAESLSFTEGDFGDELGDLADPEVKGDYDRQPMRDDTTFVGEDTFEQQTPDENVESSPPTNAAFQSPPSSTPSNTEIMEGMTSFVETAVRTIIDILNAPQMLSESEFVKSLLCDMKCECLKLQEDAHPCPSLAERFNSLISKIGDCVAATTNTEPSVPSPETLTEVNISEQKSEDPDEPSCIVFGADKRGSQCNIPELRRNLEPPAPISSSSVKRSIEIVRSLRQNFNKLICHCPSPCRSHPSVFSDANSSPKRCLKEVLLERVHCGPACVCSKENGSSKQDGDDKEAEKVTVNDMVTEKAGAKRTQQVETDYSWKLVEGHLHEREKHVEDSWEKVQEFLEKEYAGPRYEKEKVLGKLNMIGRDLPMSALYWDTEERLWKQGMMVLG